MIDLFEKTADHEDWFQADGVHPNAKGAVAMAGIVAETIQAEERSKYEKV